MKVAFKSKDRELTSRHFKELVGVLGGVGPEATNYFISLLIKQRLEEAKKDQDHVPFLLFNNPQIPDRTRHLVYSGESPLPELVETANILKRAGATFLVIPCNTCHPYAKHIEKAVGIEVMNMVELAVDYIVNHYGVYSKVGVLATDGTIKAGIYQEEFSRFSSGTKVIFPTKRTQKMVMRAIYDIKSSSVNEENTQILFDAAEELAEMGANPVVLGCTEIPLALKKNKRIFPMVDPMEVLAKEVVKRVIDSRVDTPKQVFGFRNFS